MLIDYVKRLTPLLSAGALVVGLAGLLCMLQVGTAYAQNGQDGQGDFSLQVSPSPLVVTVKPGVTTTLDLRVRNTGTTSQALKMGLRPFIINEASGAVQLQKGSPADIQRFVQFASPTFNIKAGEIFTQKVIINTPVSAGFTYSFAVTVAQQSPPKALPGKSSIQGTIAVFTLLTVDKPGATRTLQLDNFTVTKRVFEYLPADFDLTVKNSGNTLIQPKGTIYIQRHIDDKKPLAAIPLNQTQGFTLPGTSRQLHVSWNDGYPHYQPVGGDSEAAQQKLVWGGNDISKLRVGKYVAKVVAVYDDGQRDVPLEASVTFWVIPWRMFAIAFVVVLLIGIGLATTLHKSTKALRRKPGKRVKHDVDTDPTD